MHRFPWWLEGWFPPVLVFGVGWFINEVPDAIRCIGQPSADLAEAFRDVLPGLRGCDQGEGALLSGVVWAVLFMVWRRQQRRRLN